MQTSLGITNDERERVAELYWLAFGDMLHRVLGPEARARRFIAASLSLDCAICARNRRGEIVGVAGFHSAKGALVSFSFRSLVVSFGTLGALWRWSALSHLDRQPHPTDFVVEGICVDPAQRGQGIGGNLLEALAREALRQGCEAMSLRVVDGNEAARSLYENHGFEPVSQHKVGALRWLFGFDGMSTMVRQLR